MVGFYGDVGGASRFFYTAKSPRDEREAGLEPAGTTDVGTDGVGAPGVAERAHTVRANTHPTVKPLDLMRWLCRLVTTPQGTILDCFLGSGTTAMAALDEGFSCIGIEREAQYIAIAQQRIAYRHMQTTATREPTPEREQGRLF